MSDRRILITGARGFLGSTLVRDFLNEKAFEKIVGVDIVDMEGDLPDNPRWSYIKMDIRDEGIAEVIREMKVDTVVHLASIVSPTSSMTRSFLYSVDVLGTKNVLNACAEEGVEQVVVTSSGASYGYHRNNPEWLVETDALRGNEEFAYSDHKRIVEEMLAEYRGKYPGLKQLIFRPGTVLGESVSNQITDLFEKSFVFGIKGHDSPFVFVWDKDLIEAMKTGILLKKEGIFNVAGDGALSMREISTLMGKPYFELPYAMVKAALTGLKFLKLTSYGPEQIDFLRYRPVLCNRALKEDFGYTPKKNTKESFLCYLKAKNMSS